MHTPWLTTYLSLNLLDAEISPREAVLAPVRKIDRFDFLYPLAACGIAVVAFYFLFLLLDKFDWLLIAALGGWWCLHTLRVYRFAAALRAVRTEVESGLYDGEALAERLQRCEEKGLYVHNLLYPLLRLATPTQVG